MKHAKLFAITFVTGLVFGCQEVEQPKTVLTQEQWTEVQKFILKEEPKPQHAIGANFDNKIELIGVDITETQAGKPATFTWYWKALTDIKDDWKVFVHFDSSKKPFRQNLDHVPVDGMFPTGHWKKGQIIKDVQKVTVQRGFPAGKGVTYVGLYKGNARMNVVNEVSKTQEAQPRVIGPTVDVKGASGGAVQKEEPKPLYQVRIIPADKAGEMKIDGKLEEKVWTTVPTLRLKPFGSSPATATMIRVFVTETDLYLAGELADRHMWGTLKNRDDSTWTEEVLELFLDVDGDGNDYMELQITPNNVIFDANFKKRLGRGQGTRQEQIDAAKAWNLDGLETAVDAIGTVNKDDDVDTKWVVEMKIPLKSIPGAGEGPKNGDTWAVNLYRFDRPEKNKTHAYAWSTAPRGDFHQVDKFGEFKFVDKLPMRRPQITPDVVKEIQRNIDQRIKPQPTKVDQPAPKTPKAP